MPKRDFEKLLLEAVDESLSTMGESSKQAIYFHLERSFRVEKRKIPQKIHVFAEAIEKIFGQGANFLELLIMKRLHDKIGGDLELQEQEAFAFIEYVNAAKQSLQEKKKTSGMQGVRSKP